ncbi:hypothetical protein INT44_003147 [Umbelopsis vinacea]|uniref:Uncharacterized protein n=1 Tax=Umbelopsis vinacea TaxID=44442 RepID=A0A8H7UKV9_9FUNG|nr:hypothetical protein INT44_003147 [Umbelopsis vinacea]
MPTLRKSPSSRFNKPPKGSSTTLEKPSLILCDATNLVPGSLYLFKTHFVKLVLFEKYEDEMCQFSMLRENEEPMRWSEARYFLGDFSVYEAFDTNGNPPIEVCEQLEWTVPKNWFDCFALARERQRHWFQQLNGGLTTISPPARSSSLRRKPVVVDAAPDVPPIPGHLKEGDRRYSYRSSMSSLSDLDSSVRRQAVGKGVVRNPTVFHMNGSDKQLEVIH